MRVQSAAIRRFLWNIGRRGVAMLARRRTHVVVIKTSIATEELLGSHLFEDR